MASFLRPEEKEELVTCPINPCHKMKRSRLQIHLTKCVKYAEDVERKTCPFNAEHLISAPEYHHHLLTCPSRDIVERQIAKTIDKEEVVLKVSADNEANVLTESWDSEIAPDFVPGYDPSKAQKKILFPDISNLAPAERRKYYKSLHSAGEEEPIKEVEEENKPVEIQRKLKELRQPKEKPEVLQFRNPIPLNLGLGRGNGQPPAATNNRRIAANIFGQKKSPPGFSN